MNYVPDHVCILGVQTWCFRSSLSLSDWAAWVQAVGSVAAIVVGAWVIWWQVRMHAVHEYATRTTIELHKLQRLHQLVHLAEDFLQKAIEATKESPAYCEYLACEYDGGEALKEIGIALASAEYGRFPDGQAWLEAKVAQKSLESAGRLLGQAFEWTKTHDDIPESVVAEHNSRFVKALDDMDWHEAHVRFEIALCAHQLRTDVGIRSPPLEAFLHHEKERRRRRWQFWRRQSVD
jgi:hypothetical protein